MVIHLHSPLSRQLEFKDTGYVIIKVAYGSIREELGDCVHQNDDTLVPGSQH
jgi:hypothetical protein